MKLVKLNKLMNKSYFQKMKNFKIMKIYKNKQMKTLCLKYKNIMKK